MGQATQLREALDTMVVDENCTVDEHREALARYHEALMAEWEENDTFELMYAGAGCLE